MNHTEFLDFLGKFVAKPSDIVFERNEVLLEIRGEHLSVTLARQGGEVMCVEDGRTMSPLGWVSRRVARLDILAKRIIDFIKPDPMRISVSGRVSTDLGDDARDDDTSVSAAIDAVQAQLTSRDGFSTNVVYLTSNAGEGKTSLVNALARRLAHQYRDQDDQWLLVPVPLAGMTFIRLDDVIIGSLANRLRFQGLYIESVVELIKRGKLVLALDGFEEMFIESVEGDAISSLGSFVQSLDSQGAVLVSARSAFFRYKNLASLARFHRSLGQTSAEFSSVSLNLWSEDEFIEMSRKVGVPDPEGFYHRLSSVLGKDHPLLVRAVLARKVNEEFARSDSPDIFISSLTENTTGETYFSAFVELLLNREIKEKWIDRADEAAEPLLTAKEHHTLLSHIAEEMWTSHTDSLTSDVLEIIAEMVCDQMRKTPAVMRQVRLRIAQHAFLTNDPHSQRLFRFDHENYRNYYVARRVVELLEQVNDGESVPVAVSGLRRMLEAAQLPDLAIRVCVADIAARSMGDEFCRVMCQLARSAPRTSFIRQNAGAFICQLLHTWSREATSLSLHDLYFTSVSFNAVALKDVHLTECQFYEVTLPDQNYSRFRFSRCALERLIIVSGTTFAECRLDEDSLPQSLVFTRPDAEKNEVASQRSIFDPQAIHRALLTIGVAAEAQRAVTLAEEEVSFVEDVSEEVFQLAKILRCFHRRTAVNENTIRARTGKRAAMAIGELIPLLLREGVLEPVPYRGAKLQNRYRLAMDLERIDNALVESNGTLASFLDRIRANE